MKNEIDIRRELREVRRLLAKARAEARVDDDADIDMLYGAQQALGWVLEELGSPSDLDREIRKIAIASHFRKLDQRTNTHE